MKKMTIKNWIQGAVFIAVGIALPFLFHQIPNGGSIFLPMHIPVLLGGLFLPAPIALFVGMLTPFLSSVLTGMPPFFPMMPIMVFELGAYGFFTAVLFKKFKNVWVSLLLGIICGRIISGATVFILASFFGVKMQPLLFLQGALVKGFPGIIIQLILIPSCYYLIKKRKLM